MAAEVTVGSWAPYSFFFQLRHRACGILVPQPGIEPAPPAVEAQSLNHWTAREVLGHLTQSLHFSGEESNKADFPKDMQRVTAGLGLRLRSPLPWSGTSAATPGWLLSVELTSLKKMTSAPVESRALMSINITNV